MDGGILLCKPEQFETRRPTGLDAPLLSQSSDALHHGSLSRTAGGLSGKPTASDEPRSCRPVSMPGTGTLCSRGPPPSGSLETLSCPPPPAGPPTRPPLRGGVPCPGTQLTLQLPSTDPAMVTLRSPGRLPPLASQPPRDTEQVQTHTALAPAGLMPLLPTGGKDSKAQSGG